MLSDKGDRGEHAHCRLMVGILVISVTVGGRTETGDLRATRSLK
jgi:hypothetical protein